MDETGALLAAVQFAGHKAIDAIFTPLSHDVEAAVLRQAVPDQRGVLRLSLPSRATILTAIGHLIDNARVLLMRTILGSVREAEAAAAVGAAVVPPRDLGAAITATGTIWRSLGTDRPSVIGQTGALLVRGIAAGAPATEVARTVKQYFSPFFAPRRDENGKLLRADRQGAVRSWPGRAGMASQHARTVMLTETTAAHTRSQLRIALYGDQLMQYTVSRQHKDADVCSDLAKADSGFGPGVYEPRNAPMVPRHPRCRCFYTRVDRPVRRNSA